MSVDPGITTGFCYAKLEKKGDILEYWPFQFQDSVVDFWERLHRVKPDYIIIEDFEFRKGARGGLELFPVKLIGLVELYCYTDNRPKLFIQKASTGKAYYTDQTLKQLNLYVRGKPHAMDASRHLLQWFTFGFGFQFNNGEQKFAELLTEWKSRDNDSTTVS